MSTAIGRRGGSEKGMLTVAANTRDDAETPGGARAGGVTSQGPRIPLSSLRRKPSQICPQLKV